MLNMRYFLSLCFLLASLSEAAAKPFIEIEGARFRPLRIAVTEPVASSNQMPLPLFVKGIAAVIRRDLDLCGVFHVVSPKSYIVDPKKEGFSRKAIKVNAWKSVGAESILKFRLSKSGGSIMAEAFIFSVGPFGQEKSFKYSTRDPNPRLLAHRIAGDIYQFLTGESDFFTTKIAAARKVGRNKQVVLMDFDGHNEKAITPAGKLSILPTISPDGQSVLFTQYQRNNPNFFEYILSKGSIRRISARPGLNIGGQVSPNKRAITLTLSKDGKSDIYLLTRSGNIEKRLTRAWGINTSASFSPDGSEITFVSSRSGSPQIYIMNADGTKQTRKTFQGGYNQTPTWSPRGDLIAFTARDKLRKFDIFLLHLDSNTITRVTEGQGDNENPSFSPNGRLLVFDSNRTGKKELFVSNLKGTFQRRLTNGGGYQTPSWGKSAT